MSEYKHGAYGEVLVNSNRIAAQGAGSAFVYFGTAPTGQVEGGAANTNKPIVCRTFAEFKKYFGYSNDWAKYTLCEAAYAHLRTRGIGPIVCVNVYNPTTMRKNAKTTKSLTPKSGVVTVTGASEAILDTLTVAAGQTAKTKGTHYTLSYDADKEVILIREVNAGDLGTDALTIEYFEADASAVTSATVIGATDDLGTNTGIYAVKNVYGMTGLIPAFLFAPGFSSDPAVNAALLEVSHKINGHWDAFIYADLPLTNSGSAITMDGAATYKAANGYTADNEKVFFPMLLGNDGKKYHLSVIAAANLQQVMAANDGIPFMTSSNTVIPEAQNLWFGAENDARVFDDEIINRKLNRKGIASAAFVGGYWVVWGAHAASYDYDDNADEINVSETCTTMLYYLSNDFQARRSIDVDKPMTRNDIESMISDEQARLDNLVKAGALTFGEVYSADTLENLSDVMTGDHVFTFNVTTTPIAKSLTIQVNHVNDGYYTYFDIEG